MRQSRLTEKATENRMAQWLSWLLLSSSRRCRRSPRSSKPVLEPGTQVVVVPATHRHFSRRRTPWHIFQCEKPASLNSNGEQHF